MRAAAAVAALVTAAAVALTLASVSSDEAAANPTCDAPTAYVPFVFGNRTGYADGDAYCPEGASMYYTIKLINRAGNTLTQESGGPLYGFGGWWYVQTDTVSCAGAYVRSHMYINTSGQGKSDTSGENPNCAY